MADPEAPATKSELTDILRIYTDDDTASVIITFVLGDMTKGSLIDVCDTAERWYVSLIIGTQENDVMIHYIGWPPRWREWIALGSPRIKPFGAMTDGKFRIPDSYKDHHPYIVPRIIEGHLVIRGGDRNMRNRVYGRVISAAREHIKLEYNKETSVIAIGGMTMPGWSIASKVKNYTCKSCETFHDKAELYCRACGITIPYIGIAID